jgi:hypothetical protein
MSRGLERCPPIVEVGMTHRLQEDMVVYRVLS